ncbi:g1679 [Coccomyxa viridis]|uniref:G1679 protein n=1 Tax=Coccomyxa viridis TaxID=1274662 RepID=A0ABP1FK65_9CHLO
MDHTASTPHVEATSAEENAFNTSAQHVQTPQRTLTVLEARERMRSAVEPEAHRIAGVTFEGRQEVVQKLQADEAVMLEKDPKNEFDPHAIRVRRLSGEDLGFVPKDLTVRFPHDVTFGHIHNVGQVPESGVWGALVAVRPTLVPLTVDAIPENVLPYANLSNLLSKEDWDNLCRTTARAANYRCQISGGCNPDSQNPVQCQEVWAFDDDRAEMRLVGLQAVCSEIYLAKRLLRQLDDNTRQTAMWTLQALNDWTIMEAEAYLQYIDGIARDRSRKPWTVDLSWLNPMGVSVPEISAVSPTI